MVGGAQHSDRMTERLVKTTKGARQTPKPLKIKKKTKNKQTKDRPKSTSATATDAKLLHIQCSRPGSGGEGKRGRHTVTVEPMGAQRRPVVVKKTYWSIP